MRLGLIADLHGNLTALETVLADMASGRIDRLLCLGDVAALGPQPAEVVARLRGLGCPSVLGNTDAWLLDAPPPDPVYTSLTRWCASRLAETDWRYLRACPSMMEVPLDVGVTLLGFHGSPRSFDEVIAATTLDAALAPMLAGHRAAFLVGGHTHIQMLRRHGDAHLINPGSVGLPGVGPGTPELPVNRHVHWSEYAVIEAGDGRLRIDLRRVPLDLAHMMAAARASGMPQLDWWSSKWQTP